MLGLTNNFSGYTMLSATAQTTLSQTTHVLACWQRTFTAPQYWMTDQSLFFINKLLREMPDMCNNYRKPREAHAARVTGSDKRLK